VAPPIAPFPIAAAPTGSKLTPLRSLGMGFASLREHWEGFMRPTWVVLGLVVALGAVAYVKLRSKAEAPPLARQAADAPIAPGAQGGKAKPAASGEASPPPPRSATSAPAPLSPEAKAAEVRAQSAARLEARDEPGAMALEKELDGDLRDTDEA